MLKVEEFKKNISIILSLLNNNFSRRFAKYLEDKLIIIADAFKEQAVELYIEIVQLNCVTISC